MNGSTARSVRTSIKIQVARVSVIYVTRQVLRTNTTLFYEGLQAHPVGYGTNDAPDPPCMDIELPEQVTSG